MIHLRDIVHSDMERIMTWRNLPEVSEYMYTDHAITLEEHERWFNKIIKSESCRYWVIVVDSKDVGLGGIYDCNPQHRRASWAYYVADPNIRGQGVGAFVEYFILKHVFDELTYNKLCCEVLTTNEKVIAIHQSWGFKQEGLFKEHVIKAGVPIDVVAMAMLRKEWLVLKPGIESRLCKKGLL